MKQTIVNLEKIQYWWVRFSASDPGHIRLHWASKTILSVIIAVSVMGFIAFRAGNIPVTVIIFSGVLAMLGNVTVNDDTIEQKRITTLLLPFSSAIALTGATFMATLGHVFVDALLLIIIFCALYFQRIASRYFSICMVAFMSIYFSALLQVGPAQLGWLYVAIIVGITSAFCMNFIIWRERPKKTLERAVDSFRIQVNLTLDLIMEMIAELQLDPERVKRLKHNVSKLNEYARTVSDQFDSDEDLIHWKNIEPRTIRLYIFNAAMLMETLSSAVSQLKMHHAFEHEAVRLVLLQLMRRLREVSFIESRHNHGALLEAEDILVQFKQKLGHLRTDNKESENWLYLLRRIQSITEHLIKGIHRIYEIRDRTPVPENRPPLEENESLLDQESDKKQGLYPETKKAIQAVVAGGLAITFGYWLSPSHKYWMLLASYLVFLGTASVGRTFVKAWQRFLGTFLGAILGFVLDSLISGFPVVEIPLLFLCIFLGFYLIKISYTLLSFWITMMLAIMYNLLLGGINEQLLSARVLDTLIGAGLGTLSTAFLLPQRTKDKVAEMMVEFLMTLKENTMVHLRAYSQEGVQNHHLDYQIFLLASQLQKVRDEAEPLTKPRLRFNPSATLSSEITTLTAINYYAKHLVASSIRTKKQCLNDRLRQTIEQVNERLSENIETLCQLLSGDKINHPIVWDLQREREIIERGPDTVGDRRLAEQLINDLYYIWRINKSILYLARLLGAKKKTTENEQEH
ncbi:putative membrane protein YccC [Pullulanibacillus pueri]|uniref:Membrane protein n=1 Tax=Pullulanibacillus pueri TaxID=1437324 RepID=A0A8J2ZU63_9BACL|nr:FUSC family protein [Pullulanibacillus pueri]MBM7681343.1 putative membrane protein YccC [Pullulanibacillus pueri]GGH77519.1 membrane protein [Pullulanibacillus pueri]